MIHRHHSLIVLGLLFARPALGVEPIPARERAFFAQHCLECHSSDGPASEVSFGLSEIDWQDTDSAAIWERIYDALDRGEMPPPDAQQPRQAERETAMRWLKGQLTKHATVGGTIPRRLNREEYENSIRDLFDFPAFHVPDAFPADDAASGFDNVAVGLILSPPLLAQYLELATQIADEILPPDGGPAIADPKQYQIGAAGLAVSRGAGTALAGNRFRLVSSRNMASSAGWPNQFEAPQSGIYRLSVTAQAFQTDKMFYEKRTTPFPLSVYARPRTEQVYDPFSQLRKVGEFSIPPNNVPRTATGEIELFKGEIFGLRWADGPCYSEPQTREYANGFFDDRLGRNRRHYAALLQLGAGSRGMTQEEYYEATLALMNSDDLDLGDPRLDHLPEDYGRGLSDKPHKWISRFVHEEMLRFGPAIDVIDVEIEGPFRLVEDEDARVRKARTRRFLGETTPSASRRDITESVLRRFLPRAFRRPVPADLLREYTDLALRDVAGHPSARVEDGLHLAVRRALVSPNFLYRGLTPGRLDDYDLASRLSYFLTSAPPDDQLLEQARRGRLTDPEILAQETQRLLEGTRCTNFVRSFTGQWLGTRLVIDIMPDPRLLRFFDPDRDAMIQEAELFFSEILHKNHPIETFIDPDFSFRNANLNKIYGGELVGTEMQRVSFARGTRQGGILTLAAVMMATANGVDTHPVQRGVWLLKNVLGSPPPSPPGNVPAIAPDTSGATTMREQLAAHRADASCARCHDLIDPLGMVLENFDPVGRWRDRYPIYATPKDGTEQLTKEFYSTIGQGTEDGPPVDAAGTMPDGTRLNDVTDLKRYVVNHQEMFSRCLTEKLLVYATGRPLNFGDRRVADQIAQEVIRNRNGFRDLIVAIVVSESFRTR